MKCVRVSVWHRRTEGHRLSGWERERYWFSAWLYQGSAPWPGWGWLSDSCDLRPTFVCSITCSVTNGLYLDFFFFFTVLAQLLSMILCGRSIFFFTQNAHFHRRELTYANFPTVIYIWPQCLISCKDKIMKCHVTFWAEVTLIKHIIKETPESGVSTAVRMKI